MILAMLLLAGCASGQGCQTGRTGGWLSGWGSGGGASVFTLGLRRTWGECPDQAGTSVKRGPELLPAPPADPMPDPPIAPSATGRPR